MRGIARGLVALAVAAAPATVAFAGGPAQQVFTARTDEGQVWVSVDLARFRTGETYLPFVIAVYNRSDRSATLTRSSFALVAEGRTLPAPSVPRLREAYPKVNLDQTMVRVYAIPFGTRLDVGHLVPSNFYPPVLPGGGVTIQRVELPPLYWTVDMIYLPNPGGLDGGKAFSIRVHPEGWSRAIEVEVHL